MLGVASEAAVLEVAPALATVMKKAEANTYLETINARKQNFVAKFEAFAQSYGPRRTYCPRILRTDWI